MSIGLHSKHRCRCNRASRTVVPPAPTRRCPPPPPTAGCAPPADLSPLPCTRSTARALEQVTCGSLIKLQSDKTGHLLHSHEVSYGYGRGSGQQSVTAYPEHDSANSLWVVRSDGVSGVAGTQRSAALGRGHVAGQPWLWGQPSAAAPAC